MRKRRQPKSLILLNLTLFSVFSVCLWLLSTGTVLPGQYVLKGPELEVLILQTVSGLLLLGALQLPHKTGKTWRAALLTLSFIALSESSLVALLTPVA